MQKRNEKEQAMLEAIEDSIAKRGYAPSVRELCDRLGYRSTSTVQMYLDRLEQRGYIRREDGKSRSISLCRETTAQIHKIPLLRADVSLDAPLNAEFVAQTLDFCYCGELPDGAELFAHELASKDGREVAVVLRRRGEERLQRIALIKLL